MKLTYLGHSCFLLISGGCRVFIDPFISSTVGMFTKGYAGVLTVMDMLRFHTVVGTQDNTFPPIAIDGEAAFSTVRDAGGELHWPGIGSVLETVN